MKATICQEHILKDNVGVIVVDFGYICTHKAASLINRFRFLRKIISDIKKLQDEISIDLKELDKMLKD